MPLNQADMEHINQRRNAYAAQVERVRADKTLSDVGRRVHLAAALTAVRRQVDQVMQAARQRDEKRYAALTGKMFKLDSTDATTIVSYRDALDRAEAITEPGAAKTLMNRAIASGDTLLSRAVFARAWSAVGADDPRSPEWNQVIGQYATAYPNEAAAIQEAGTLANLMGSPDQRWKEQMATTVSRPRELSAYQDHQIERIADTGTIATTLDMTA